MTEKFNFGAPEEPNQESENDPELLPSAEPIDLETQELRKMYDELSPAVKAEVKLLPGMNLKEFFRLKGEEIGLTAEQYLMYLPWQETVAEIQKKEIPVIDKIESGPKVAEFISLIEAFERKHNLPELHAISDLSLELDDVFRHSYDLIHDGKIEEAKAKLSPEDLDRYEKRLSAKEDLIPIVASLKELEVKISRTKYEELKEKYMTLNKAVGLINKQKIDHTR